MAGPSYFEQLKTYLASAQSQAGAPLSLVNPDDPTQTVEISMQSLPDRPDGWPAGLPEPLMLESERAAGLAFISSDNGETYLLFRDAETSQPLAMSYEDVVHLTESLMRPVLEEARGAGNQILIEQLRAYTGQLNDAIDRDSTTGVNFGSNIPVAQITDGGVIEIREYDERHDPEPAPAPVAAVVADVEVTRGASFDRAGETVGVVIEGPEEDLVDGGQDVVPEPTAGYVLAGELAGIASTPITAIDQSSFYNEGKGVRVLEAMRRNLGTPPDPEKVADYFDGRDEYKQIEESWRPIAAQYIQDSVEAGYALPLGQDTKYRQSLEALEQGRVEDAQTLLAGGEVAPVEVAEVEVQTDADVEEEVYSPGRVDPPIKEIEPAAGDGIDADEAALRAKVEATTAEIEGLLRAAGEDESGPVHDIVIAMQTKAAIAAIQTNFADAIAENGTIDVSKLPVSSDFGDDFTADEELRQLAERLNGLHEQYGSMDLEQRALDVIEMGPR